VRLLKYVYMRNIAPTRTRKAETVIAITEPVDTDAEELFDDEEEDALGVGLGVEATPGSVASGSENECVDEPEAPSNKLDPGLTPVEAVSPPETPLAVGATVAVTGI
jgi:hypothetical protein